MGESWEENQKFILEELRRLSRHQEILSRQIASLTADVIGLRAVARIWGAVSGMIPALFLLGIEIWRRT